VVYLSSTGTDVRPEVGLTRLLVGACNGESRCVPAGYLAGEREWSESADLARSGAMVG
jgi:hypothetical protein